MTRLRNKRTARLTNCLSFPFVSPSAFQTIRSPSVGGEFSSKQGGDIGSKFEKDGSIGGKAQELSDKAWDAGKKMKGEK